MNDTKKFLLSLAMFVTAFVGAADSPSHQIYEIDSQIFRLRREISDLRILNKKQIEDSLRRNPAYVYVQEYREKIDSLRLACNRLIAEACEIVHQHERMTVVPQTPVVFMLYSKYPGISSKRTLYDTYRCRINYFEQKKESVSGFELGVKNHCDSIMHAEIDRRQIMIDSLLNKKMELTR